MAISPLLSPLVTTNPRIGPNPITANTSSLSPFGNAGLNHTATRLFAEMSEKKDQLNSKYENQIKGLDLDEKRIFAMMRDLSAAKTGVEKGLQGIETIEKSILEMRSAVTNIEESVRENNEDDIAYYKLKYDNALARLNEAANDYSSPNNLIGSTRDWSRWAPNTIEYMSKVSSRRETTINGYFLGSDFLIETDSGTAWVPSYFDSTTTTDASKSTHGSGGQITLYKDLNPYNPHASGGKGDSVAFRNLELVSRSSDTVTLQYTDEGNTKTITGTLKQGGLGIAPSFLYDVKAPLDLEKMRSDLSSASSKVFTAKTTLESHQKAVARTEKHYSEEIQNIARERQKIASLQYVDTLELENDYRRQYDVMQQNYDIMVQSQQAYVQAFQSTMVSMGKNNPFFDIIG